MCGIFGVYRSAERTIDVGELQRAVAQIRHRGPDDEGYLVASTHSGRMLPMGGNDTDSRLDLPSLSTLCHDHDFNVALGHRRLSILDLSPNGHQPMCWDHGRYWIVFNGEIYNYIELREELKQAGHKFRTQSDTEVILAAYRAWNEEMLSRFTGMFALAILDMERQEIFLARDPFGIKPLYYTSVGNQFAFSSEIKPLLELKGVSRRLNPQELYQYLRFDERDAGTDTMFRDVSQLPPGCLIRYRLQRTPVLPSSIRYFRLQPRESIDVSYEEAVGHVRELFLESVRLHMRSDVQVGSCLSGGLDSSGIVMAMAPHLGRQQRILTFSFITESPEFSEEKYVDLMAQSAPIDSFKISPGLDEVAAGLDSVSLAQELPSNSIAIYAQYAIFRLAAEKGIKVMLDGQGADEIFGGYDSLVSARVSSLLFRGEYRKAWRLMQIARQASGKYGNRLTLAAWGRLLPASLRDTMSILAGQQTFPAWLNRHWFQYQGVSPRRRFYAQGLNTLKEELAANIEDMSLPRLLRYEDRNSMASSVEARVPFCMPKLAQYALSLPEEYVISSDGQTKRVLRDALRPLVPDPILKRRKIGFAAPEQEWLRGLRPWLEEQLNHETVRRLPFLNHDSMTRMINRALGSSGLWPSEVWRCLDLIRWVQRLEVEVP